MNFRSVDPFPFLISIHTLGEIYLLASLANIYGVQPSGSSSTQIRCQLPCYLRRQINNDDLIASIDRTDQSLTNCLSLMESALAMIQIQLSSEADLRELLARAEVRIIGKTATIISFAFP